MNIITLKKKKKKLNEELLNNPKLINSNIKNFNCNVFNFTSNEELNNNNNNNNLHKNPIYLNVEEDLDNIFKTLDSKIDINDNVSCNDIKKSNNFFQPLIERDSLLSNTKKNKNKYEKLNLFSILPKILIYINNYINVQKKLNKQEINQEITNNKINNLQLQYDTFFNHEDNLNLNDNKPIDIHEMMAIKEEIVSLKSKHHLNNLNKNSKVNTDFDYIIKKILILSFNFNKQNKLIQIKIIQIIENLINKNPNIINPMSYNNKLNNIECIQCNNKNQVIYENNATIICTNCGNIRNIESINFISNNNHTSKDRKRVIAYNRSKLYNEYLMQFSSTLDKIPDYIIKKIINNLNLNIKPFHDYKPTPINNIIKKLNLHKYSKYAWKISKIINNETIPVFSETIIKALNERFEILLYYFKKFRNKKDGASKFINFEFLTKQFLHMENELNLASQLTIHKTPKVLYRAEERLKFYCDLINKEPTIKSKWYVTYYR